MNTIQSGPFGGRFGFSLTELVVVLGLIALAAVIAGPAFRALTGGREGERAAREMLITVRVARWRAIVTGNRTRIAFFPRGGERTLWYVVEREDHTVWIPEGEARSLPEGTAIETTGPAVKTFNPNGTCSMGSIVLSGSRHRAYRLSFNAATGRVRLYRGAEEVDGA